VPGIQANWGWGVPRRIDTSFRRDEDVYTVGGATLADRSLRISSWLRRDEMLVRGDLPCQRKAAAKVPRRSVSRQWNTCEVASAIVEVKARPTLKRLPSPDTGEMQTIPADPLPSLLSVRHPIPTGWLALWSETSVDSILSGTDLIRDGRRPHITDGRRDPRFEISVFRHLRDGRCAARRSGRLRRARRGCQFSLSINISASKDG